MSIAKHLVGRHHPIILVGITRLVALSGHPIRLEEMAISSVVRLASIEILPTWTPLL